MRHRFTIRLPQGCLRLIASLLFAVLLSGCSTTAALNQARAQYLGGDPVAALATLSSSDVVDSKDQLLYWMEKSMVLHDTGNYEDSAKELLAASRYLEQNDYISLREEATELVANEWAGNYAGEYSEQLWIHSYLMMNFLSLGQYESAAVEARQALARIESHPDILQNDHFSRALIALSFEAAGQLNDSYIEYRKLAEDANQYHSLDQILLPQALRLGFANDALKIKKRLQKTSTPNTPRDPERPNDAIVFVASGVIPQKFSGSIITGNTSRLSFPQYYVSNASPPALQVYVNKELCSCQPIYSDLGQLVSESLNQRGIALAAKSLLRAATKDALADAIGDKDEIVGELARLLLFALEEADTRSWQSLPRYLTMLRIPLPADGSVPLIEISASGNSAENISVLTPDTTKQGLRFYPLRLN